MRIGIIGYGSVGSALHQLIYERAWDFKNRYGLVLQVVFVCDRSGCVYREGGINPSETLSVKKSLKVLSSGFNVEPVLDTIKKGVVDVAIECTPANFVNAEPAYTHIIEALKNGSNVITTNKGPMALYMPTILEEADSRGLVVLYSGTVGGGTPFIYFADKALKGNKIESFRGILNGTSNFILSKIINEGSGLEEALAEAKKLGIAEADPTLDLNGTDSAAKLVILLNHVFEDKYTLKDVEISGIEKDIPEVDSHHTVKLIASSTPNPHVSLEIIPKDDPLNIDGTFNAVEFKVEELGSVYLIGKGAGGRETAGAVMRDLVELKNRLQIQYLRKGYSHIL
ncbi:MAG: homoserine dehydrogenase [Nitrososphaeria archaeon]|jgi:homoserine dehydrogenase